MTGDFRLCQFEILKFGDVRPSIWGCSSWYHFHCHIMIFNCPCLSAPKVKCHPVSSKDKEKFFTNVEQGSKKKGEAVSLSESG